MNGDERSDAQRQRPGDQGGQQRSSSSDERSGQQQQQQERGREQPGHQGLPQADRQREASDHSQTQKPRPTWGEQTPQRDRERSVGGGGSSSDSDGQQQ